MPTLTTTLRTAADVRAAMTRYTILAGLMQPGGFNALSMDEQAEWMDLSSALDEYEARHEARRRGPAGDEDLRQ